MIQDGTKLIKADPNLHVDLDFLYLFVSFSFFYSFWMIYPDEVSSNIPALT